jgi:hypothetical protein
VFLARFDYLVVIGLVPIALAFRLRTWRGVRAWCLGAFSLLAPIGIWWLARWGHVLTTSATVKSAELDRTIGARFGGRFSLDYLDYLGDLATAYVDRLSVWKIGRRLPFGASDRAGLVALANVLALAALATAALGWVTSIRRWARARVHSLGPTAWAVSLVLAMLVVKAVVDLVAAPLWASGWYSAGQRLAVGFVFGAGLVLGVRWCADRFRVVTLAACAALLLFVLPFNVGKPFDVRDTRHTAGWQDQIDLAATWITRQGPPGRYGARDAGLLAHRLDGTRTVVNLDGLVNDYEFAALVEDEASLRARASATSVMFFVGRLSRTDVEQEFGCGVELWRSPELIYYSDSLHGESREPLRIIDLRSCT